MSNDWLKKILEDTAQRVAQKPEWARSDYAQGELARLKAASDPTVGVQPAQQNQNKTSDSK
jgi:hypothetical protein